MFLCFLGKTTTFLPVNRLQKLSGKVENILKGSLDLTPSPSLSDYSNYCQESLLGIVNKLLKTKPAMFCLFTSSKFSRQWFEFSLKVKVLGFNPGYLLKSLLLYKMAMNFEFQSTYYYLIERVSLIFLAMKHCIVMWNLCTLGFCLVV